MKHIRGIVFDLDGVLISSSRAIDSAVRRAVSELGLPWRDSILEVFYKSHREVFARVYCDFGDALNRFDALYSEDPAHLNEVRLQPYASEILDFLKRMGLRLAISTTKDSSRTTKILNHFGFDLDTVVTADDTLATRPDPEPLLLALNKIGVIPDQALYVGDTPLDIVQGRNATVSCVGITTGHYPAEELWREHPTYVIKELNELNEIVRAINGIRI